MIFSNLIWVILIVVLYVSYLELYRLLGSMDIYSFHQIFVHNFFKYLLCLYFFWVSSYICVRSLAIDSQITESVFFSCVFSVCFIWDCFCSYGFTLTDFFFLHCLMCCDYIWCIFFIVATVLIISRNPI